MQKKYKILLAIIIVFIVVCAVVGLLSVIIKQKDEVKEPVVTEVIANIEDYGYTLEDRDTQYMQDTFKELEDLLSQEEIDEEKYASLLSKLFIIDFYTLKNKINKYDVGALEYIISDKQEAFKLKAMDTIYKDIIDNTYKDRRQDLPEVVEVNIESIKEDTLDINEGKEKLDVYKVGVSIKYAQDYGYDKEGTIYLTKKENKLEIIKFEPSLDEE